MNVFFFKHLNMAQFVISDVYDITDLIVGILSIVYIFRYFGCMYIVYDLILFMKFVYCIHTKVKINQSSKEIDSDTENGKPKF